MTRNFTELSICAADGLEVSELSLRLEDRGLETQDYLWHHRCTLEQSSIHTHWQQLYSVNNLIISLCVQWCGGFTRDYKGLFYLNTVSHTQGHLSPGVSAPVLSLTPCSGARGLWAGGLGGFAGQISSEFHFLRAEGEDDPPAGKPLYPTEGPEQRWEWLCPIWEVLTAAV